MQLHAGKRERVGLSVARAYEAGPSDGHGLAAIGCDGKSSGKLFRDGAKDGRRRELLEPLFIVVGEGGEHVGRGPVGRFPREAAAALGLALEKGDLFGHRGAVGEMRCRVTNIG
jgi:hypothetical protein